MLFSVDIYRKLKYVYIHKQLHACEVVNSKKYANYQCEADDV